LLGRRAADGSGGATLTVAEIVEPDELVEVEKTDRLGESTNMDFVFATVVSNGGDSPNRKKKKKKRGNPSIAQVVHALVFLHGPLSLGNLKRAVYGKRGKEGKELTLVRDLSSDVGQGICSSNSLSMDQVKQVCWATSCRMEVGDLPRCT
jgi:hypothetical protein